MRSRTFPKENKKKMNETIRDLKSELKKKDKEIKFLRSEIDSIMKPNRDRKHHVVHTEEWRVDFLKRFKKDVLGDK